ncbi:MAG: rod shape-determining protein MreC [Oscillospiraceae bacterium]|nr:rod shape-determining protein MreC [Oscillospiraceae bacterium]
MKKHWSGRVKLIVVMALILAMLTAIASGLFGTTWMEKAVQTVLTPIRGGFSSITRQIERYYNYIFGYEALEAKNAYLEQRIMEIEDQIRSADGLERENAYLRELLNLSRQHDDYHYCDAYIVSWDSSNWKSTFTIGKGTNAGLETGMVAVTQYGQVVGLITEIGANWAVITTVMDTSLEISASLASSGHTGVVQGAITSGEKGKLRMIYLPSEAVLRNNDQVVTTGSTVYPKDLIIGYVIDAGYDETGVAKYALLNPAADFDTLEQIFIITDFVSEQYEATESTEASIENEG